ncbi:MAG: serine hydrolase [Candidatus Kerfeldbacteria bacterium]
MFNHFILSLTIISYLLGIPLPDALQQDVYIVPTIIERIEEGAAEQAKLAEQAEQAEQAEANNAAKKEEFQWRLEKKVPDQEKPPVPKDYTRGPVINAGAAIVLDQGSKNILWQKNPDDVASIASITKLMTALVWLSNKPEDGFEHVHTFAPEEDVTLGKELQLPYGSQVTAQDLLRTMLVASYNDAALALAHTTGLTDEEFVKKMNRKAKAIGMQNTTFRDQTGLYTTNRATVHDVALLALEAFSKPTIAEASAMPEYAYSTLGGLQVVATATNALLFDDTVDVVVGKTGYLIEAGYCLVVKAKVPGTDRYVIAVVLNTESDSSRFAEMKKLLTWTFDHYAWN